MLKKLLKIDPKIFGESHDLENRHIGISYTAFGWFLIALSSVFFTQTRATHSLVNTCFHQYLAAFMAVSLWAAFKGKKNFFCKNPFLVIINSFICMLCFYISYILKMTPASTSNSYLLNSDSIIAALILIFAFKQKISFLTWLGLIMGFIGVMSFFSFNVDFSTFKAISDAFICLVSAALLAVLVLLTQVLLQSNPPIVIALSHCMVGLFCSGAMLYFSGWQLPTNFELFCMGVDGFIYGISLYFFITALYYVESYIVMSLSYLLPVYLIIINLGLKRGGVDLYVIVGALLVIVGVAIIPIPAYLLDHKKKYTPPVH
ncbi:MAG: hypothetical protein S4CHLAM6_09890 [Chlamydiae bacterium]|nr:hypothetical protein [Chlamydiota bacterium]